MQNGNDANNTVNVDCVGANVGGKILSEREIADRVERMLVHLDHLLEVHEMDQESYDDAVRDIAVWEESAMLAVRGNEP